MQIAKFQKKEPTIRLETLSKALVLSNNTENANLQGEANRDLGLYYRSISKYDTALILYENAIRHYASIPDSIAIIGVNIYEANIYRAQGEYNKALVSLLKSDSALDVYKDAYLKMSCNNSLGNLYLSKKKYSKALLVYKVVLKYAKELENERGVSIAYNNISAIYSKTEVNDSCIYYAKKAIALKKKLNLSSNLASPYNNMASAYSNLEQNDTAAFYYLKSLEEYRKIDHQEGMLKSYNNLGETYRKLGEYALSESYLLKGSTIASAVENHLSTMYNERYLFKLYRDKEDWERAFKHVYAYDLLKDSLAETEKIQLSEEYQVKYETEKFLREKTEAEAQSVKSRSNFIQTRNISIAVFLFAGILAMFAYYRFRANKKQEVLQLELNALEERLQLEKQNRYSELKALQSQMNPHFVFNSLNSIQDLILLKDVRNSNKYLGNFSDLMRKILQNSNKLYISAAEELQLLELYAPLEKLRFGDDLSIEITNKLSEATANKPIIPSMFIQPYVENAFKHGLLHQTGHKELKIIFEETDDSILITIDDNGVGRQKAAAIKARRAISHESFSSAANDKRVELLNEGVARKIDIMIEDKPNATGTLVRITFPKSDH